MEFISDTYIHYGHRCFVPELFLPIKNIEFRNKPEGGLWASPVNAEYGWRQWCEDNDMFTKNMNESFRFRLKWNAEVWHIHSVADLKNIPKDDRNATLGGDEAIFPDFEELRRMEIDAVELHFSEDPKLYMAMYGWDCDSILILNRDVIEVV